MMSRFFLAAVLCASLPSFAAEANRYAATAVATERFNVGATLVERHGSKGAPLILIPGLASGAWVWQHAIAQFGKDHTIYVLTLPGFDGHPGVEGKGMAAAQESIRALIDTRKLKRAVLIGHSLGATMSLALAAAHPDLLRGVVAIDGLPVMPGTEEWPAARRAQMVTMVNSPKPSLSIAAFTAQQQQYMRSIGTLEMSRADELAKLSGRSDAAAVARYMSEALGTDLRSALPAIKAPVLLITPYSPLDAPQLELDEVGKAAYYQSLMQGTPNLTVTTVSPSRHFAMFDQPQKVSDAIGAYLKALPR